MYAGRLDKTYVKVIVNAGKRVPISETIVLWRTHSDYSIVVVCM
jgi:hypothetical protein